MDAIPCGAGFGELIYGKLYLWTGYLERNGILGSVAVLAITWFLGFIAYIVANAMGKPVDVTSDNLKQ